MEKIARGKRASEAQKEYLINYLQMHVELATDKFVTVDGAKFREEKWRKLAEELNAIGGTIKDGAKWRKYWSDLRLNTRTKYCEIKRQEERSGVNGMRTKGLTEMEEKIIQITTTEALDGDATPEIGCSIRTNVGKENDDIQVITEDVQTTEAPVSTSKLKNDKPISGASFKATRRRRIGKGVETDNALTKLVALKEQKIAILKEQTEAMHYANKLKEEQVQVIKEQTKAINRQTEVVERLVDALKDGNNLL